MDYKVVQIFGRVYGLIRPPYGDSLDVLLETITLLTWYDRKITLLVKELVQKNENEFLIEKLGKIDRRYRPFTRLITAIHRAHIEKLCRDPEVPADKKQQLRRMEGYMLYARNRPDLASLCGYPNHRLVIHFPKSFSYEYVEGFMQTLNTGDPSHMLRSI